MPGRRPPLTGAAEGALSAPGTPGTSRRRCPAGRPSGAGSPASGAPRGPSARAARARRAGPPTCARRRGRQRPCRGPRPRLRTRQLGQRQGPPTGRGHPPGRCPAFPDEVFIKVNDEQKYLWRAVDADSDVLDILVQSRRDTAAARRFFRKLLKGAGAVHRVVVTDKLRSYGAAHREVMPSVEHRSHKGRNNRAENSHQPTRQRERAMKGFRSVGAAQRLLAAFSGISPHFRPRRHLRTAADHRLEMTIRFTLWNQITGTTGLPTAV
ncbi:DDE superfamily endonuclease [Streptomyces sp. 846.5]|nr:DDE superfamily endonuclease [Streptomyces sp. 846.5]